MSWCNILNKNIWSYCNIEIVINNSHFLTSNDNFEVSVSHILQIDTWNRWIKYFFIHEICPLMDQNKSIFLQKHSTNSPAFIQKQSKCLIDLLSIHPLHLDHTFCISFKLYQLKLLSLFTFLSFVPDWAHFAIDIDENGWIWRINFINQMPVFLTSWSEKNRK